MSAGRVVTELWGRIQARDWDGVGELLADDLVLEWPNAGIRIRGRSSFVEFNRTYPEGWSIEVLRVVEQRHSAVSEVRVPHPTVGPFYAISFLEVEDGESRAVANTGSRSGIRNRRPSAHAGSSGCDGARRLPVSRGSG